MTAIRKTKEKASTRGVSMKKILIANRGEIAARIIRTCRRMGIETVAVYTDPDKDLPYVQQADKAVYIGSGPVKDTYLNKEKIIDIARTNGAEGIHPGYGFLSENSVFARETEKAGITFIGPRPDTLALMGDKISARKLMQAKGIPVVPGTFDDLETEEEAIEAAREIGFPVMLKASGGGGGIGMQICRNEEELRKYFSTAKARARNYFGSDQIFIEKFIENARHAEVQIFADSKGNTVHLFERDCSVQRRNQKVIEETHAPSLSPGVREKLYKYAVLAAEAVSYVNCGTVEFIVDEEENCYFLEMNTRLQVEHPVTEMVCGVDLVEWQIEAARGNSLPKKQQEIRHEGHAIEFRVYAEDPVTFYPSPGKITRMQWGSAGNVRIDNGYNEGNTVSPFYDPLIAKVIFYGASRLQCIEESERFFRVTKIEGIKTNIPLLIKIARDESFKNGNYTTNFLKKLKIEEV